MLTLTNLGYSVAIPAMTELSGIGRGGRGVSHGNRLNESMSFWEQTQHDWRRISDLLDRFQEGGFWYGFTGQPFGEWLESLGVSLLNGLVYYSDLLILAGVVCLLLIMYGSTRARKWLYWTVCGYVSLQMLGLLL